MHHNLGDLLLDLCPWFQHQVEFPGLTILYRETVQRVKSILVHQGLSYLGALEEFPDQLPRLQQV
ncbi:hypothetical protein ES703_110614 [subsurface metagenome]